MGSLTRRRLLLVAALAACLMLWTASRCGGGPRDEGAPSCQQKAEHTFSPPLNNEYEVVPFTHFTFTRVFPPELSLGKRVVERPLGARRKELQEVFVQALAALNAQGGSDTLYVLEDFLEGMYRTLPSEGTRYELVFRARNASFRRRVVLIRPFGPLRPLFIEAAPRREIINVIVPLSANRRDGLRIFLSRFIDVAVRQDGRVFLTLVYCGAEGLRDVQVALTRATRRARFKNVKLLWVNGTFSRGRALQAGAEHWSDSEDVLILFSDVDVVLTKRFLERCRLHATPRLSVYYPIVFSLYNPALSGRKDPVVSRDTGFWRDFGFGMSCQYRSDFLAAGGFPSAPGEDVLLYRRHVRSPLRVVRATDPGIFHTWHPRHCDREPSKHARLTCLHAKAVTEGSHAQLGLLAFREELEGNASYYKS